MLNVLLKYKKKNYLIKTKLQKNLKFLIIKNYKDLPTI